MSHGAAATAAPGETLRRLVWIDREGRQSVIALPDRGYTYPRIAADGITAAFDIRESTAGIWQSLLSGSSCDLARLGEADDFSPLWMGGDRALLLSRRRGSAGLFLLRAGLFSPLWSVGERLPVESSGALMPTSLHPDGEHIVATRTAATGFDIVSVSRRTGDLQPLLTGQSDELNGEVSPDGRWLAYQSRASGQFEIWLRAWNGVGGPGVQVTTGGGTRPVWTHDGHELLAVTNDGVVMSIATDQLDLDRDSGHPRGFAQARQLFVADLYLDPVGRTFDLSADDTRLLAIVDASR